MNWTQTLVQPPSGGDPRPSLDGPLLGDRRGQRELVLDRYRRLRELGHGGFGVVWEAHDELLHRTVALKCISLPSPADRQRARREALANARLTHPAIVALYDAHTDSENFYLVAELIRGPTLHQLIASDGLSDHQVARVGATMASALEYAHSRGVIHRDVKPSNILLTDRGTQPGAIAKLADFGGAHLAGDVAVTHTGDVLGTLAYMPPEQWRGAPAESSGDLYSLALSLYEAFSGINPVRDRTFELTARRLGRPIPPLERHRGDLPVSLTRQLDRALAPAPDQRGTLEELHEQLRRALAPPRPPRTAQVAHHHGPDEREAVEPSSELHQRPARPWQRVPRGIWLTGALGVLVWQAAIGQFGVALLLAAAALPLLALPRRGGPGWMLCASAPALGAIGLAGVYPAIGASFRRWHARLAAGALGYWWLALAEPVFHERMWLGSALTDGHWRTSVSIAATHAVAPLLNLGMALGALLWATGALLLPFVVRGRRVALDAVAVSVWVALLVWGSNQLAVSFPTSGEGSQPRGLVLSSVLCGLVAVTLRAARGPV